MKSIILLAFFVFTSVLSQETGKVGLVLSGGGAKAFAHVGVLKAMEEKGVQIDYIVGTSGGALIGGLYVSGYTPEQIEKLVTSEQFYRLTRGELSREETYFFYQGDKNSSFLDLKFNIDSNMLKNIPSNLVNPTGINYYLFEKTIAVSDAIENNFDSLMIPFRCVASDIFNKKSKVFDEGEVHNAIRASMSFPMFLNPITINDTIYVDGGLYQNYPIGAMVKEFHPDIIIGCDVGNADELPNEEDALTLITVMASQRDTNTFCANEQYTVYPETGIETFDFDKVQRAIDSGYAYTLRMLDSLKLPSQDDITMKRLSFLNKISPINIRELEVEGVSENQAKYIESVLIKKKFEDGYTLDEFKKRFYNLLNSSYVRRMRLSYDLLGNGDIKVKVFVVPEKAFQASFGGFFSSRPVNMAYLGLQYQFLGKIPFTVRANSYFGKYYGSVMTQFQANWPIFTGLSSKLSFYMNRVDYYDSYSTFFEESKPSYIIDEDIHIDFQNELYLYGRGVFNFDIGYGQKNDEYFETFNFALTDTMTRTRYSALRISTGFEHNSLNRPQFASEGVRLAMGMSYHNGNEVTAYGTTDPREGIEDHRVELINLQLKYEHYLYGSKYYSIGIYGELNYAFRDFFLTYVENLINVPSFAPVPELGTFFIPRYRNDRYLGAGLINVISYKRKVDLRLEGYFYQAIQTLESNENNSAVYSDYFSTWGLQATGSLIYHSFIGPIRFSSSYVLGAESPWIFQLSIGYLFYNKRFMQTLD